MNLRVLQRGFNYSQDGPGNRLVCHLQGCNLHCPWCSNPESMAPDGGEETSCEALISQCVAAEPMFFDGGGVTFTGGEPTVQFEALKAVLSGLKEKNIHTAIETNGTNPRLPELFELIDFLIMDFKHHDNDKLKHFTGVGNNILKQNIILAAEKRTQLLLRIPLINGFNASTVDAERFCEFLKPLWHDGIKLELLRYHEYGKDKWLYTGMEYKMQDAFVSDELFEEICSIFKANSITLIKT